jgi:hypothetical protein
MGDRVGDGTPIAGSPRSLLILAASRVRTGGDLRVPRARVRLRRRLAYPSRKQTESLVGRSDQHQRSSAEINPSSSRVSAYDRRAEPIPRRAMGLFPFARRRMDLENADISAVIGYSSDRSKTPQLPPIWYTTTWRLALSRTDSWVRITPNGARFPKTKTGLRLGS